MATIEPVVVKAPTSLTPPGVNNMKTPVAIKAAAQAGRTNLRTFDGIKQKRISTDATMKQIKLTTAKALDPLSKTNW